MGALLGACLSRGALLGAWNLRGACLKMDAYLKMDAFLDAFLKMDAFLGAWLKMGAWMNEFWLCQRNLGNYSFKSDTQYICPKKDTRSLTHLFTGSFNLI